jgi:hypothetical protein
LRSAKNRHKKKQKDSSAISEAFQLQNETVLDAITDYAKWKTCIQVSFKTIQNSWNWPAIIIYKDPKKREILVNVQTLYERDVSPTCV